MRERPNKRMQLTKLRAAPVLQAEVPPCAPAGEMDGGTASQLIRGVVRTMLERRGKGRLEGNSGMIAFEIPPDIDSPDTSLSVG
jgi:hypothetical protein